MAQEDSQPINAESEQDWLLLTQEETTTEVSESPASPIFDLDDTPLTPAVEIQACSILNPNCDVCQ